MNGKSVIFVDTDAFVAVVKQEDTTHEKSIRLFQQLQKENVSLLISNYIFLEVVTVISQKVGHKEAVLFIDNMQKDDSLLVIKRVDEELEEEAIRIFKAQTSKNVSFVDCTNMAFLKRGYADAIFSFDEIYRKNGYVLVEDMMKGKK